MSAYGQFCAIARAHEALGGRWTLLIVRELLCGSRRFTEIRRGIPRISPTLLSERLESLVEIGAIKRASGPHGPEYELTAAGNELNEIVVALASWGQKWLVRDAAVEDLDLDPLLVDMQRRVRADAIPEQPAVIRFEVRGRKPRFMLMRTGEVSLCARNPGFPEHVTVRAPLSVLAGWWRGDFDFPEARRQGLVVDGPRRLVRQFPNWFQRYMFAQIPSATA